MRTDLPTRVKESLYDLSPEAMVTLYRIELTSKTIALLSPYQDVVWQGETYSSIPCQMSEISQESDGKVSRPKFSFVNPEGIWTSSIMEGGFDNAWITRYRILKGDMNLDLNHAVTEKFRVSKIQSVTRQLVVLELRDILDGHSFKLPARSFYPPDFPHVQLG
jgi:phage-related protein